MPNNASYINGGSWATHSAQKKKLFFQSPTNPNCMLLYGIPIIYFLYCYTVVMYFLNKYEQLENLQFSSLFNILNVISKACYKYRTLPRSLLDFELVKSIISNTLLAMRYKCDPLKHLLCTLALWQINRK